MFELIFIIVQSNIPLPPKSNINIIESSFNLSPLELNEYVIAAVIHLITFTHANCISLIISSICLSLKLARIIIIASISFTLSITNSLQIVFLINLWISTDTLYGLNYL